MSPTIARHRVVIGLPVSAFLVALMVSFVLAAPAQAHTGVAAATATEGGSLELLIRIARMAGYLATAVVVGGLAFLALLWPAGAAERRTHRVLVAATGLGLLAAIAAAALHVHQLTGSLSRHTLLHGPLTEETGRPYAAMVLLWVLAGVVVVAVLQGGAAVVRRLTWRVGAVVVAAGLIRTIGMSAHAAGTSMPLLSGVADFLHITGASAWVGGLVVMVLCLLPGRSLAELHQVVPRFSRVALVSVLMIVASGLVLLWQIISPLDGFWSSRYGAVVVIKVGLFAAVMVVAMNSKRWVDRSLERAVAAQRTGAARFFAASVAAESLLAITVLGAASVLTTSSPGV